MRKFFVALMAAALFCCTALGIAACSEKQCEHNYEVDTQRTVAATCYSDGIKYLVCSKCGDEKTEADTNRPAHSFGEGDAVILVKIDETHHAKQCTVEGCNVSDTENKEEHSFVSDTAKMDIPATCHSDGIKYLVCSCGEEKTEADTNRPAHNYGEDEEIIWVKVDETHHAVQCIVGGCGYVDSENIQEHNFTADTTKTNIPATCHSDGTVYLVCKDCGEEKTEADTNRPEHNFVGEWIGEADGHHQECQNDGCTATSANVAHNWIDGDVITPPTDTADGERKVTCDDCGYESTAAVPALNHEKGNTLMYDGTTHWYPCVNESHTDCNVKFDEKAHKYEIELPEQGKPATCKEDGIRVLACECGATREEIISKTTVEHKWDNGTVTKPATCQEKGEIRFICTVCGETKTEELNKADHNLGESWVKVDEIYHAKQCTVEGCGELDLEHKAEHNFVADASKTDIPATCHSDGTKYLVCSDCGAEKTEVDTNRPAHNFDGEWIVTEGGHYHECLNDGCTETEETVLHTWEEEITKQPTLWADGEKTYTCTVCGHTRTETLARENSISADINDANWKFGVVDYQFNPDSFTFTQATDKNGGDDGYVIDGTEIKNDWFSGAKFDTFICIAYTFEEDINANISVSFKGIGGDDGILSDYSLRIAYGETPEWGGRGTEFTLNKTHSFNAGDTVYFIFKHETDGWDQGTYSITINRIEETQN